ncbi:integrase [Streptomyces sp. NBC_00257]|uniref:integrase n=1 Tax=unclassified Streptomyces TaxID=2593676 RepID=UPI0022541F25|nr:MULTISPECIES: integrase [unclassified Streptomyces]MCX4870835.1 integrase [Streptomyces sp. NBC_00906]MCX4901575.1 integrase [Streptomyces sp. NBC_00892]MCX5426818.1 integrase [Streptomyces sp. NBC_00062]
MILNQHAAHPGLLFGDDEPVLQSHPLLDQARDGSVVLPRFGDTAVWDFNDVVRRPPNLMRCQWRVQFSGHLTDPAWNLLAREVLMALANPHHDALHDIGVHLGDDRANIATLIQTASKLRQLIDWANKAGLPARPGEWNHRDLHQRIKDLQTVRKPGTVTAAVAFLKKLAALGPALTGGWPADDPWKGRSARQVANCPGRTELSTEAVRPEVWFPLIRAAWAYVHTFAPDILRATRRYEELRSKAAPSIAGREAEVAAWIDDPRNKIPVYSNRKLEDGSPRVHWRLLDLLVGLSGRPHCTLLASPVRRDKVMRAVAEGRITREGLASGLARVRRPDGTTGPWHRGITPNNLFRLHGALRNAAFVLVAGLSMMRDSEIQAITRDSVVEHYNSPAIASTLQKDHPGLPRKHWWITEPVAEAIAVAEAVSVHADRVFAPIRLHNFSPHGPQMVEQFIAFANAGRTWSGLDEIPPGKARPHMFRRTMAMLTDQFPGSEIALGIQLKHVATRALANRSTRGYAASDPAWAGHLQSAVDAAKFRRIKDLYGDHTSGKNIGFGPGADRIKETFDHIEATVAARSGDSRVEDSLLRKARITIRFGTLNHCLFDEANPAGAICLENAILPEGHTGPLENRCRPDRCHNSVIGPEHVPIYDSHRRTQLKLLDNPALPAARKMLITRELEGTEAVLAKVHEETP